MANLGFASKRRTAPHTSAPKAVSKGAWQKSHYHTEVEETYIVQKGWIAFATKVGSARKIEIFRSGEIFSTAPDVIHNVYMSAYSIIHTVKHGTSGAEDRKISPETSAFDQLFVGFDSEHEILKADARGKRSQNLIFSAGYRHFDDLIWRTPVWASGIFTITILGLDASRQDFVSSMTGVPTKYLAISFLVLMFFVLLALSHALYRFRDHQRSIRVPERKKTLIWKSASTFLSAIVIIEAFALASLALMTAGVAWLCASSLCLLAAAAFFVVREAMLRVESRA